MGDYRIEYGNKNEEFEQVVDWTYYYPHYFKSAFGAYLIPSDIEVGERVFLEDLIADYIGASWNQGDKYRLESAEAIWTGSDLEIHYDPKENSTSFVG